MKEKATTGMIEDYLKLVRKALPDSFETDDLIDEIRAHIMESLNDKQQRNPEADSTALLGEVLSSLGEPEEIAFEWGKIQEHDEIDDADTGKIRNIIIKQTIAIVAVVGAAWFVSSLPNSIVDFWTALVVLMLFVVAEYVLRNWQKTEVKRINADVSKKY